MNDDIQPRHTVQQFAQVMERQLQENDHKGGWENCTNHYLAHRLQQKMDELQTALDQWADPAQIIKLAADAANYAHMIADNASRIER